MSELYSDLRKLCAALHPEARERTDKDASYIFRLIDGEPVGRLVAELVRASAPTMPPPREAETSPIPDTLPLGPRPGAKGKP